MMKMKGTLKIKNVFGIYQLSQVHFSLAVSWISFGYGTNQVNNLYQAGPQFKDFLDLP